MSGLGKIGGLPGFVAAGDQVSARDIDRYEVVSLSNPAVDFSWFGTASGTVTAQTAIGKLNQLADWPRNFAYSVNGITNGTYGGTFTANGIDQFGVPFTETVAVGTAVNGGTVYGTQIAAKFISGSFISQGASGTFIGTARIGAGTAANGSASSNWFGLLTKIGGTNDLKLLTWINNGTPTALNVGTAIGTLVDTTRHAFQGTSGVALTDSYKVIFKPSFDNASHGTMCKL